MVRRADVDQPLDARKELLALSCLDGGWSDFLLELHLWHPPF